MVSFHESGEIPLYHQIASRYLETHYDCVTLNNRVFDMIQHNFIMKLYLIRHFSFLSFLMMVLAQDSNQCSDVFATVLAPHREISSIFCKCLHTAETDIQLQIKTVCYKCMVAQHTCTRFTLRFWGHFVCLCHGVVCDCHDSWHFPSLLTLLSLYAVFVVQEEVSTSCSFRLVWNRWLKKKNISASFIAI